MLRNDYVLGEELPADDVNDIVDAIMVNQHNIFELYLENYYASLSTPSIGLFFDGFSDTSKIDQRTEAITLAVSNGQPDVEVDDGTTFFAGEEVDIFDTTVGKIETKIIDSIAGNVLTMTTNFAESYTTSGFVTRSSVDIDTGLQLIQAQPELAYGVYRSNKVEYQQAVDDVRFWSTRALDDGVNRFAIGASVIAGATTITIAGDQTIYFENGDTVDISNAENTLRERVVLTATPTFGAGFTTLTFAGDALANGYSTTGKIERVDILPEVSLVDTGDDEDFQPATWLSSLVDFDNDTVEDAYEFSAGSPMHDFILKLILD